MGKTFVFVFSPHFGQRRKPFSFIFIGPPVFLFEPDFHRHGFRGQCANTSVVTHLRKERRHPMTPLRQRRGSNPLPLPLMGSAPPVELRQHIFQNGFSCFLFFHGAFSNRPAPFSATPPLTFVFRPYIVYIYISKIYILYISKIYYIYLRFI